MLLEGAVVEVGSHILKTMIRIMKPFIMGKREAVMVENILVSS